MGKTLLIIDGSQMVYASHFAKRKLITSTGTPSGVIHGVYMTMWSLRDRYTHIAFVLDRHRHQTFRHKIWKGYKSNREHKEEDIGIQDSDMQQVVKTLGIRVLYPPKGYEADDLIASLAHQYGPHISTTIRSRDKDFLPLLGRVKIHDGKTYLSKSNVKDRFGIDAPKRVHDFLTISGDGADGIPGIKGWGKVKTSKWINEGGTWKTLLASDMLTKKERKSLKMSNKLVRMVRTLVVPSMRHLLVTPVNEEELKSILDKYEIKVAPKLKKLL